MKPRTRTLAILGILAVLLASIVYNYVFNSAHRNIATENASVVLSANELHTKFIENETLATTNYLDKVIEAKGKISAIEDTEIVLDNKIQVSFNPQVNAVFKNGENITIKGRCVGYDELLEMVKIDQSIIIK